LQSNTLILLLVMTTTVSTPRVYGRTELAQRYFPTLESRSAWQKLRSWLQLNSRLRPLVSLRRRTFTPAEVQLIFLELGEP